MTTDASLFTDIYALLAAFYGALDDGTADEAAALFLPDGTWMRQGRLLTGPAAVRAALDERPADRATLHLFCNLRLSAITGDGCTATYGLFVNIGHDGPDTGHDDGRMLALMTCSDHVRRTGQGWRFASRTASLRFRNALA